MVLTGLLDSKLFLDRTACPSCSAASQAAGAGPTLYPVACAPQAWAAAAVFLLLHSCLGLTVEASHRRVSFLRPVLPPFLERVRIRRLTVGDARVDLLCQHHQHDVSVRVLRRKGDPDIIIVLLKFPGEAALEGRCRLD